MNWKNVSIIIATGLLTFALGWKMHDMKQFAAEVLPDSNQIQNKQNTNPKFATIRQDQLDSLMLLATTNNNSENFAQKISGRFMMKGAKIAGFDFFSPTLITWTNEMDIGHPDTLKIKWLNNTTFFTQDIKRLNEACPPRVWIYQVIKFDGQNLDLKDIWTGWNNFKDEKIEFVKNERIDN